VRTTKELYIDSKNYAQEIRWLSWFHLLIALGLWAMVNAAICSPIPWEAKCIASVLSGLLIVRLFIMYHDYHHGAILKNSWIAHGVFTAIGWLTLSPDSVWRGSHDHHHRHNCKGTGANPGSFRLMTRQEFLQASAAERWSYIVSRHWLTIGLGYLTVFLMGMSILPFLSQPRRHWDGAVAVLLHATLLSSVAYWSVSQAFFLVVAPLIVACGLGSYLFYAQHNFPGCKFQSRQEWTHAKAALHSSSYIRMSPWMQWFTGNVGLHHVHHLNAKIPFYRLPEAMEGIAEFQSPGTTSLHPLDVVRCLRLNLWDPDEGRLVSYREARRLDRQPRRNDGQEPFYDLHSYAPDVLDEPATTQVG
jgi:omega-6 fatty acid desaturase (delta-12 desaturase)